jgi:hypothetical protein
MMAIETVVSVGTDGKAVIELQLPSSVPAGRHRVVVVVSESQAGTDRTCERRAIDLPVHDCGP